MNLNKAANQKIFEINVRETHNATYKISAATAEEAQEACTFDIGIDKYLTNRKIINGTILEMREVQP